MADQAAQLAKVGKMVSDCCVSLMLTMMRCRLLLVAVIRPPSATDSLRQRCVLHCERLCGV